MTSATVHIIGAGLAGLSTATILAGQGRTVAIYEAAPHAGGRCRTFWDPRLERHVDNGNHLLLTGNRSARAYLDRIGGWDRMDIMPDAIFPFADLGDQTQWRVRLNAGPVPWWVTRPDRRIPGTGVLDYVRGAGLALAGAGRTVAEAIRDRGAIWTRFWEPLTLAALNTTPERAAAPLLWRVLSETFARGAAHCRPMLAPKGLGTALVDPAVAYLEQHGIEIAHDHALKGVTTGDGRLTVLHFANGRTVEIGVDDHVVAALPPTRLKSAMPWIDGPRDDAAILNAHFVIDDPARLDGLPPITGLINSRTHWVFLKGDLVSLTISAADRLGVMDEAPDDLLPALWDETCLGLGLTGARYTAGRINKERRATIDQSPAENAKRPHARTKLANLTLAGDGTRTGLPATIEGAIRSGETAAKLAA